MQSKYHECKEKRNKICIFIYKDVNCATFSHSSSEVEWVSNWNARTNDAAKNELAKIVKCIKYGKFYFFALSICMCIYFIAGDKYNFFLPYRVHFHAFLVQWSDSEKREAFHLTACIYNPCISENVMLTTNYILTNILVKRKVSQFFSLVW